MKYLNVLAAREIPEGIKHCLSEQPHRAGMYNWIFAHKGEIRTYWDAQDELEDYDVVHVNMSPMDMSIVPEIRRKLGRSSDTKLVINNDHVCEIWKKWDHNPYYYHQSGKS